MIFFWKIVPYLVYFGQSEDYKLLIPRNCPKKCNIPKTRQSKTAWMKQHCLCEYKKLYFQDKILCLSSNQDLIPYEGDWNF